MTTDATGKRGERPWATMGAFAVLLLAVAGSVVENPEVDAHAELVRAEPAPDSILAVPPRKIELWMSERVATGAGSPSIEVVDQQGRAIETGAATVDSSDPTHIAASVLGITAGTYTVLWSVRSEVDGHTLTGSFAVRIGAGRAPGAGSSRRRGSADRYGPARSPG